MRGGGRQGPCLREISRLYTHTWIVSMSQRIAEAVVAPPDRKAKERTGTSERSAFWGDATRYAAAARDEPFVDEVAYMMVTLHRTGA